MRKIYTTTFLTMDGVIQAPGGPSEDTTDGFKFGGWSALYWDDIMSKTMDGFMNQPFELLLGKRTYDIFAAYWPHAEKDHNVAKPFNSTRKYVVSHTPMTLSWKNSTLITNDVVEKIRRLKEDDAPNLWVHGSASLIQTLIQHKLIDRMHLWIFPVTVGKGKKLFAEGTQAEGFKLVDSKICKKGVIIASYESTGDLKTGSLA